MISARRGYSFTSISDYKVILTGGYSIVHSPPIVSSVFEGNLWEQENSLVWKELPSFKIGRTDHATFNLGKNLYVVGGWTLDGWTNSCEVFNIYEKFINFGVEAGLWCRRRCKFLSHQALDMFDFYVFPKYVDDLSSFCNLRRLHKQHGDLKR